MPGSDLIVPPDESWNPGGPMGFGRRRAWGYVLAGMALSGWVGFALLAIFLLVGRQPAGSGAHPATAVVSETVAPRVLVGPVIVAEPWEPTPFPIQVSPTAPKDGWVRITGVPALASLSAGFTIGRGVWKVPLAGLSALTIMAPARDTLRSDLSIALMSPEGSVMMEVLSSLAVIPPALCGAVPSVRTGSLPDDIAPGPVNTPPIQVKLPVLTEDEDRRRAQELVLLGEMQRLQGRLSSARGYYEQAAIMGSPRGAMALAATFDPYEIGGTTLRPDIEAARVWYRQSRELMDAAITFYLKRLDVPGPR